MERHEELQNENHIMNASHSSLLNTRNISNTYLNNFENANIILRPFYFSSLYKYIFKIIFLTLFLLSAIFFIDLFFSDEKDNFTNVTSSIIDNTIDKCSFYLGTYLNGALEDVDYLIYNQRSSFYYYDKFRELRDLEQLSDQEESQEVIIIKNQNYQKQNVTFNNENVLNQLNDINITKIMTQNITNNILNNFISIDDSSKIVSDIPSNEILSDPLDDSNKSKNPDISKINSKQKEIIYDYKYNLVYEFVKNVSLFAYKGKWTDLKIENNTFDNIMGVAEVEITKNYTHPFRNNYISNIEAIEALYLAAYIKDGDYRDNYININMTIIFPKNFSYYLYDNLQHEKEKEVISQSLNNKIELSYQNMTIKYVLGEIFGENNMTICNNANVNIKFIQENPARLYKSSYDNQMMIQYPRMSINIRDDICKFAVDMILDLNENENYEDRIWNYSLIMTSISIVEIYLTLKLLYEVSENDQVGKNICLITLSMNILWNSFICTIHFYLSITNEDFSYEYGTPSMTYFLLFSIFELRLIFFIWRARNHHLAYTDVALYRKKLLRFYSAFCIIYLFKKILFLDVFLFVGLLSMRYFFSNFWTCYILFASTWFFQIIHSTRNGTKPPFSMYYVFILTLGKIFTPLYIKGCPYNIFELKPAYWKMFIIIFTILIEVKKKLN